MALLLLGIAMEAKIIINSVLYIYLHFLDKVTMTPIYCIGYVGRTVSWMLLAKAEKMWELIPD
jgi:hypothetical protein